MADYATTYIRSYLDAGLTPTAALRDYRAAGGQTSTQAWYRAWGEAQASLATATQVGLAPLDRPPTAEEVTPWTTVRESGYLYRAEILYRPVGTNEIQTTVQTRKYDTLVDYATALDDMATGFEDSESGVGSKVIGGFFTEVNQLEPGEF